MTWPSYVQKGEIDAGPGYTIEDGEQLKTRLKATASRSLVWDATGAPFTSEEHTVTSELGAQAVMVLPVTDQPGWRDGATGDLIDVTEPDTHTHTYKVIRELLNGKGQVIKGSYREYHGVVVPTGSGQIDLDLMLPAETVEGAKVSIPDTWSETLAESGVQVTAAAGFASAAQAAAGAAATSAGQALEAVAPVAEDVANLKTVTTTGRLSETGVQQTMVAGIEDPESEIGSALSTKIVELAGARNTVVLFGTSLEHQNRESTETLDPALGSVPPVNGRGWFHWCNAFLGDQLRLVRNSGIEGNTYQQMLARLDADVLAYDSDWVFMGGPVNDLSQGAGRAAPEIIADGTEILDRLQAAGRKVLILTPAPSTSYDTASKRQAFATVSEWIRTLPYLRPNVIVVDAWKALVNPATGAPATGMTTDDIVHYSQSGAARIGRLAADAVRPHISMVPARTTFATDPSSAIANPNFLTNGAGWAPTASVTPTYVADDAGFGNKAVLTFNGNTSAGDLGITFTELVTAGRFASGDVIQLTARFKWSGIVPVGVVSRIQPVLRCRQMDNNNAFIADSQASALFDSDNNRKVPVGFPASGEAVLRTFKTTVRTPAAGIKSLALLIGFVGIASGVVEVSDLTVRKV